MSCTGLAYAPEEAEPMSVLLRRTPTVVAAGQRMFGGVAHGIVPVSSAVHTAGAGRRAGALMRKISSVDTMPRSNVEGSGSNNRLGQAGRGRPGLTAPGQFTKLVASNTKGLVVENCCSWTRFSSLSPTYGLAVRKSKASSVAI